MKSQEVQKFNQMVKWLNGSGGVISICLEVVQSTCCFLRQSKQNENAKCMHCCLGERQVKLIDFWIILKSRNQFG